jgi:DNA invertase Pin-like site-specific DNA recombinase
MKRLSAGGDPLEVSARVVDFEAFRPTLVSALAYSDGTKGGRPPYDPVVMLKVLVLAAQNNVADARMEWLIRDRLSWLRFLEFDLGAATPDANTIRTFRERLTKAGALETIFADFDRQLKAQGYLPMGGQIIDFARPGGIICVVRLDRLGRSLKELLETVDGFKAAKLAFRSLEEGLDTSSAAGELVFHVFGAIAHFERRLIVERTRDGIAAARARGKVPGRPTLDPDKLASALKLIEAGVRPAQAAKQLGLGRSTLYRELAIIREAAPETPSLETTM